MRDIPDLTDEDWWLLARICGADRERNVFRTTDRQVEQLLVLKLIRSWNLDDGGRVVVIPTNRGKAESKRWAKRVCSDMSWPPS